LLSAISPLSSTVPMGSAGGGVPGEPLAAFMEPASISSIRFRPDWMSAPLRFTAWPRHWLTPSNLPGRVRRKAPSGVASVGAGEVKIVPEYDTAGIERAVVEWTLCDGEREREGHGDEEQ
jgi:hypothetical protein